MLNLPIVEGVQWEKALERINDKDLLMEIVRAFCNDAQIQKEELDQKFEDMEQVEVPTAGLYNAYRIQVHAMKTTLATIGAMELAESAQSLEDAGRDEDADFIFNSHDLFCENYCDLAEKIEVALKTGSGQKTVLLIGDVEGSIQSIYSELHTLYQVQVCPMEDSLFSWMMKMVSPDLVVVYQALSSTIPNAILGSIQRLCPNIPVLVLCPSEDYNQYYDMCPEPQFHFLFRPITISRLTGKCEEIFGGISGRVERETSGMKDESREKKEKPRILIVDDSLIVLKSFKKMLQNEYEIQLSFTGESALEVVNRFMPDIIFLDYEMPGMNGVKTLQELRKRKQLLDVPVVFLTGISDKEHVMQILSEKPDGYLLKPMEEEKIRETLVLLLGKE